MNKRAPILQQNQSDRSGQSIQMQQLQEQLAEKSRLLEQAQRRLAELEAEQDFLKAIINYLPTPVFVKEARELRFILWNKASEALFGFNQEAILGKNDYDLFPPHEADFFTDKDRLVLAGDQALDIPEEPIHTPHQGVRWLHTRKIPIRGEDSEPKYLLGVSEDISERKRVEAGLNRLARQDELILESAGEGIFGLDTQGKHIFVNRAASALLGYEVNELLGRASHSLWHHTKADGSPYPDEECPIYASYQDGEVCSGEEFFWRKDGSGFPVEFTSTPIKEGDKIIGAVVTFQDITERKRVEQTLARRARLAAFTGDVGLVLTHSATLPELLQKSTEVMVSHLDAAFARIWTYNPTENVLELRASAGIYTHINGPHARVPVGKFKIGLIAQEREPHLTNDVLNDPRVGDREWARREGMLAFAGYPLIVEDRLVGVMALFARQTLSEDVLQAMQSVANMIALSIERKQAEEGLTKRAAELTCLNDIGRELEVAPPVPDLLEWVAGRIPPAMQYPALCRAAIEYEGQVYGVPEAVKLPTQMTHGLYIGGQIKGRIYIAYTAKYDFLNEESSLLGGIASRLSNHLENRHLFEQVQARVRREQLLREVTTRIRGSVDVDTVMRTVAREVGQALGRPAFIYLESGSEGQETPPVAEKEETQNER